MKSRYGKECPKHPELAGRRYYPSNVCVGCNRARSSATHTKHLVQAERLAKLEQLLLKVTHAGVWFNSCLELYDQFDGEKLERELLEALNYEI